MNSNIFIYIIPSLLSILYFFDTSGLVSFFSTKILYGSQIFLFSILYILNNKKIEIDIFFKIFIFNLVFLFLRIPGLPEVSSSLMGISLTVQLSIFCFKTSFKTSDFLKLFIFLMIFPVMLLFQESPLIASGIYIPNLIEFNEFFAHGLLFFLVLLALVFLKIFKFDFHKIDYYRLFYSILISFISFNLLSAQTGEDYGFFFNLFAIIPSLALLNNKNKKNISILILSILAFGFLYLKMDYFLLDRGLELNGENNYHNGLLFVNSLFYSLIFHSIYLRLKIWRSHYADLQ